MAGKLEKADKVVGDIGYKVFCAVAPCFFGLVILKGIGVL